MKAAILTKLNTPLEIKNVCLPTLVNGQVLVDVRCTGICGAQLQEISGQKGDPQHLPHLLGHEGWGEVLERGPGVRHVAEGNKVVMHWRKGIGCDAEPATYDFGRVKAGPITTFSQYAIVSANRVTKIPDDVPGELGALFGCALSTALATVENVAKIRFGERVLIVGCGGVGLSMILAAKLAHARPVIGYDIANKGSIVRELGGEFIQPGEHPFNSDLEFDVIINTIGHSVGTDWLAPSGRYIFIGQPRPHDSFSIKNIFKGEGQQIIATQGGGLNPTLDIPRYVNLWRSGALDNYEKLISHIFTLDNINTGIDLMREGKTARVMIYP
jgi:S-(hydroxymethyl)glutathione dehydrogenase / alcohol dehydrogenase